MGQRASTSTSPAHMAGAHETSTLRPEVVKAEREKLLDLLAESIPPHELNKKLRVLLDGVEDHSEKGTSIANPATPKKRKANSSTTATRTKKRKVVNPRRTTTHEISPTFSLSPPWKAGDGDPPKTCWFKEVGTEPYGNRYLENRGPCGSTEHVHCNLEAKIAEKGVCTRCDKHREEVIGAPFNGGYTTALVHENVNLKNPGELAWMFVDYQHKEYTRIVFHTEEEANLYKEKFDKEESEKLEIEEDHQFEPTSWLEQVRVEYSMDELDMEYEYTLAEKARQMEGAAMN